MTPNREPQSSPGGRLPLVRQQVQIQYSRLLFFTVIIVPAALLAYTGSGSLSKPVRPHISRGLAAGYYYNTKNAKIK